jgi:hypothetical protein
MKGVCDSVLAMLVCEDRREEKGAEEDEVMGE